MKEKYLKLLKKTISWLEAIYNRNLNKSSTALGYSSLSPINNGDENGHYSKAILWALNNRKTENIKNIALTGPYGSGKSSIIKTFQKNNEGNGFKFLNISLATFKEEKPQFDKDGIEIKVDKTDLLRLIEISILEQIFYHENDSKIPDSRFKKIKSYSQGKLFIYSIGYLIFTIALINYFDKSFIQSIFKDTVINPKISDIIHYLSILIIAIGMFSLIMKSVRIISSITVNKLTVQNTEIGLGENKSKSILNHHIDEILYFFSIRPYNVVIIEDLDRFQETEIFTKLREVNLLLNHSEKTKRKEIVFIYAVRDDMFTDTERTKFFDFIIPVIPVINSTNSNEILFKKRNDFHFALSDNLIEELSFFIDDMRLLHNISNEFILYKEKLNENLNQDKLFAIITYKNIYPNDFMKLSNNEGNLYKIFNSKSLYINKLISEIEGEIENQKNRINEYEKLYINNITNLRLLYVIRIVEKLPGFSSFVVNSKTLTINEIIEDKHFEYLKTDNYTFNQIGYDKYNGSNLNRVQSSNIKISDVEKLIDDSKSYDVKEKEVIDIRDGMVYTLKNNILELETKKINTRKLKISELFKSSKSTEIDIDKTLNKNLILSLLRNGYIAEDYSDYISLFHEESITRSDYRFKISIKNEISMPFDYKLFKIEKLISRLSLIDFETEFILNFTLVDYLLEHSNIYNNQIKSIFYKLKDESKISLEFITRFYNATENITKFLEILCEEWSNIWNFIYNDHALPDSLKKKIFRSILEYANINSIRNISYRSNIKNQILADPLFLSIFNDFDKLKTLIKELRLKFKVIDIENSPDEMVDFIYQNNFYQLEPEMIESIIKKYGEFDQVRFDNSNYSFIQNSNATKLIELIDTNLNSYIKDIYLHIPSNINEEEAYLINLLNNDSLSFENKVLIIDKVKTKVSTLSQILKLDLYPIILQKNKLVATWENLLHDFNINENLSNSTEEKLPLEISESSIKFINIIENAEELSKTILPTEVNSVNIYGVFWKKLIQTDELDNVAYSLITKSNPWWYSDLNFSELSENKIKSLINNNCIKPGLISYNAIKSSFNGLNVLLFEKNKSKYFEIIAEIAFDSNDIELILKSKNFSNLEILKIVNLSSDEILITNNNLKLLSSLIVDDSNFILKENILNSILISSFVPVINRLKIFIKNSINYDSAFIESFLSNLGGAYLNINDTTSKAKLPKSIENLKLLNILIEKNYISSYTELDSDFRVNHRRK